MKVFRKEIIVSTSVVLVLVMTTLIVFGLKHEMKKGTHLYKGCNINIVGSNKCHDECCDITSPCRDYCALYNAPQICTIYRKWKEQYYAVIGILSGILLIGFAFNSYLLLKEIREFGLDDAKKFVDEEELNTSEEPQV